MRRRPLWIALLGMAIVAGCGDDDDDDSPLGPTLEREAVAGVYDFATFTFDPNGLAPERSVLSGFEAEADLPQLFLGKTSDAFQIRFRDPVSGLTEELNGTYQLLLDGVRLSFASAGAGQRLLLPDALDLEFDEEAITFSFADSADVSVPRVKELVPDYAEEPWVGTVPGKLTILLELNRR